MEYFIGVISQEGSKISCSAIDCSPNGGESRERDDRRVTNVVTADMQRLQAYLIS